MSEQNDSEKQKIPHPTESKSARRGTGSPIARADEPPDAAGRLGLLLVAGGWLAKQLQHLLHNGLTFDRLLVSDPQQMLHHAGSLLGMAFLALLPFVGGLFLTAVATPSLIGGLNMSAKALKFNVKSSIRSAASNVCFPRRWCRKW